MPKARKFCKGRETFAAAERILDDKYADQDADRLPII